MNGAGIAPRVIMPEIKAKSRLLKQVAKAPQKNKNPKTEDFNHKIFGFLLPEVEFCDLKITTHLRGDDSIRLL